MAFQRLTNWRRAAIPKPKEAFGAGSEQCDGRSAHLRTSSAHMWESASNRAAHVALSSLVELLNRHTDQRRQQCLRACAKEGKFRLAFPPDSLTAVFDCTDAPLLAHLHANLHKYRTLTTLRDTLLLKLLKLLSGELSVAVASEETGAFA